MGQSQASQSAERPARHVIHSHGCPRRFRSRRAISQHRRHHTERRSRRRSAERLQAFVNSFDEQCRRTGLDAEVIVVEWNPPAERPRVRSLLRLPEPSFCSYRFIDVPAEIHDRLRYADVLPLFQMIAKNAGIRRARGRFVLATNIDIIFSTELIDFMASRELRPGCLPRRSARYPAGLSRVRAPRRSDGLLRVASAETRARWGNYPVDLEGHFISLGDDVVDGRGVRLGEGWHVREGGERRLAPDGRRTGRSSLSIPKRLG